MTERTVSVVLPTYNEKGNIGPLLSALRRSVPCAELIVVDDASTDGTLDEARAALPGDERVRCVARSSDRGLAASILDGIRASRGDAVVVMDTDFSHDPELVPVLLSNLDHFELASGSRYVHGGGMYSLSRYAFSYLFNLFARHILGTRLTDHLSGFFAIRRAALERMEPEPGLGTVFTGYGDYYIRLLFHHVRKNGTILEIPSWYQDRSYGSSKTRFLRTFLKYSRAVLRLRARYGSAWIKRRKRGLRPRSSSSPSA